MGGFGNLPPRFNKGFVTNSEVQEIQQLYAPNSMLVERPLMGEIPIGVAIGSGPHHRDAIVVVLLISVGRRGATAQWHLGAGDPSHRKCQTKLDKMINPFF